MHCGECGGMWWDEMEREDQKNDEWFNLRID
jgi:hypothetical protein